MKQVDKDLKHYMKYIWFRDADPEILKYELENNIAAYKNKIRILKRHIRANNRRIELNNE